MTESEAETELHEILCSKGKDTCQCGREIDRADVAWNEGDTGEGTPFTWVTIQCQACDEQLANFSSWYPSADTFEELVEFCFEDWK